MKVCVVGCGPCGLVASRHLKISNIDFLTYERSEQIGGTWVYTDDVLNEYGHPVHTAMYQNLRTNFPKELMEFEGLKFSTDKSFLTSQEILDYLKEYAAQNGLNDHIKVGHIVTNIINKNDKWFVTVEDLINKKSWTSIFDNVIICNGHHFTPRYPDIKGRDLFKGIQIHSKDYRKPNVFQDKTLLVIGFGYSGQDMTADASKQARKIFVSHHATNFKTEYYPENVISKTDIQCLHETSVTFTDGSVEQIDAILYCTGYKYNFPFLDSSCGINCDGDYVSPLYKHFININHPTMAFIGLNFSTFVFFLFEAQVKAFVKILLGEVQVPSKEDMLKDLEEYEKEMNRNNVVRKKYHMVRDDKDNLGQLNQFASLQDIPEVIYKIQTFNVIKRRDYVHNYRKYLYKVIDEQNFTADFIDNNN